jgi:hypothetical protein
MTTSLASSNIPLSPARSSARPGDDLERCAREIAEMERQENAPAWLVTMGIEDWKREQEFLK